MDRIVVVDGVVEVVAPSIEVDEVKAARERGFITRGGSNPKKSQFTFSFWGEGVWRIFSSEVRMAIWR